MHRRIDMARADLRQILVATDFSQTADAAVHVAHAYARAFGARLHVFHVTWPDEHGLTTLFARLTSELGSDVPVVVASHRGDPAEEIVRYARGHNIDLIVLGTHGRTGVSRLILGSVAERVIRTAPCPVLSVPPADALREDARVLPPSVHHCVACQTPSHDLVCEPCRARLRGQREYAGPPTLPGASHLAE
jgi:nucleotide-binding universal stress UspA family protein